MLKNKCFFQSVIFFSLFTAFLAHFPLYSETSSGNVFDPTLHKAKRSKNFTSFTQPRRSLKLAFEVSGRLKSIHTDIGKTIGATKSGWQIVATLDQSDIENAILIAEKQIKHAQLQLTLQKTQIKRLEQDLRYQVSEKKRTEKLLRDGISTDEKRDAQDNRIDQSQYQLNERELAFQQAETQLQLLHLEKQKLELNLDKHQLKAPSGWVVNQRISEPGQVIQAGQVILELLQTKTLLINFYLNEEEHQTLLQQKEIYLNFPQSKHQKVKANILNSSKQYFPNLKKRLVQLEIDSKEAPAASGGLEVALTLNIEEAGVFKVPEHYVQIRLDAHFVKLSNNKNLAVQPRRKVGKFYFIDLSQIPKGQKLLPFQNNL